jgi:leader peptidase (prepilin peptidase)/N-methyltransferase
MVFACYTNYMINLDVLSTFLDAGFVFLLGLIVGSFLNVVVYRLGSGRTVGGRSGCMSCGKELKWYMLIPVFSWLMQGGRCAYCRTKLSMQYPLVEAATGLLFLIAAKHVGFSFFMPDLVTTLRFLIDCLAFSSLVALATYDFRHKIIPDELSAMFAVVGLCAVGLRAYLSTNGMANMWPSLMPLMPTAPHWLDLAAAPLLALPLWAIWHFSNGRAMGLGDAKLIWGAGWFLGFLPALSALVYAFWIASIPSLIMLITRKGTLKTEIPFGPFIVLGIVLVYYFGWNVLNLTANIDLDIPFPAAMTSV